MTKETRLKLANHFLKNGNKEHPYVKEFEKELGIDKKQKAPQGDNQDGSQ